MYLPIGVHQYCGSTATNFDYYSGKNEIKVKFISTRGNHGKGFKLAYGFPGKNTE